MFHREGGLREHAAAWDLRMNGRSWHGFIDRPSSVESFVVPKAVPAAKPKAKAAEPKRQAASSSSSRATCQLPNGICASVAKAVVQPKKLPRLKWSDGNGRKIRVGKVKQLLPKAGKGESHVSYYGKQAKGRHHWAMQSFSKRGGSNRRPAVPKSGWQWNLCCSKCRKTY